MWWRTAWRRWSNARDPTVFPEMSRAPSGCRTPFAPSFLLLQPIGFFDQAVCQILRHDGSFILIETVFDDQLGEEGTIHAPRHVVARRDREKGARVVVKPDSVIEAGCFRNVFAITQHALRAVVKPPGWAK